MPLKFKASLLVICFCIAFGFVFISCANRKNYNPTNSSTKSIWIENLVLSYKGHNYKVTKETTKDIDNFLEKISFHGNGTMFNLYSIKNVKNHTQIAVDTKDGYLIAVLQN